jgi:hypothetical protein
LYVSIGEIFIQDLSIFNLVANFYHCGPVGDPCILWILIPY